MIPSDNELIEFYKEQDSIDAKEQHKKEMIRVKSLNHLKRCEQLKNTRQSLDSVNAWLRPL